MIKGGMESHQSTAMQSDDGKVQPSFSARLLCIAKKGSFFYQVAAGIFDDFYNFTKFDGVHRVAIGVFVVPAFVGVYLASMDVHIHSKFSVDICSVHGVASVLLRRFL